MNILWTLEKVAPSITEELHYKRFLHGNEKCALASKQTLHSSKAGRAPTHSDLPRGPVPLRAVITLVLMCYF